MNLKLKLSQEKRQSLKRVAVCSLTPIFLLLLTLQLWVGWPINFDVFTTLKNEIINASIFQPANKTISTPSVTAISPSKSPALVDNR